MHWKHSGIFVTSPSHPSAQPSGPESILARIATLLPALILLVVLAAGLGTFLERNWKAMRFPYPLDYGEGPLLDQSVRLSKLQNIYNADLISPPYTISNYPPIHPLVQVPFVKLFGPAFWYGRALNLIALLAGALFLGQTIHITSGNKLAALSGGAMLLTFPYVLHWSALDRVDSLAVGFSCAALFTLVRFEKKRSGLIGTAALLTAAIFTRQSFALATPLAAFVWLLRGDQKKRAFLLAGWTFGFGLASFLLISVLSKGGFYFHVVDANINTFRWSRAEAYFREFLSHSGGLMIAGLLLLPAGRWFRDRKLREIWWLAVPFLIGSIVSAMTVGKSGSNVNYFLELCAALALTAGVWIARSDRKMWLRTLLILLLALQVGTMVSWGRKHYYHRIAEPMARAGEIAALHRIVQEAEGPVLADEHLGLLPISGKSIYFQPFEMKQLLDSKLWNPTLLLESIRGGRFPVILIYEAPDYNSRAQRWSGEVYAYINEYYRPVRRIFDTVVYMPGEESDR